LVSGRWIERAGERRRRYYRLTAAGRRALARERSVWRQFVLTIDAIVGANHA
jgi:DNA-binding PadR family transcriptional regulator